MKAAWVSLESTKEQTEDTPPCWLMAAVVRTFNEHQVRKPADDTRRGMRKPANEGGWNGGLDGRGACAPGKGVRLCERTSGCDPIRPLGG